MCIEKLDEVLDRLISQTKKLELYRFIAGILILSRVTFQNDADEKCFVSSTHLLKLAAELLSVDCAELNTVLTKRTMNVPGKKGEAIRYVIN